MKHLAFLDTETTSLRPDREAWEVGYVRYDATTGERSEHVFTIQPVDLGNADPFALGIGGFYERHPYGQYLARARGGGPYNDGGRTRDPADAATVVARDLHNAVIVGLVPGFDTEVLGALLRAHRLNPGWHYHPQDVETAAVGSLTAHGVKLPPPPWNSDELSERCGVNPPTEEERHTALGDALWCERWWIALGLPIPGREATS